MRHLLLCFSLLSLLLLPGWPLRAQEAQKQQPARQKAGTDSVLDARQRLSQALLERALLHRIEDSLRKAQLREQMEALRAGDKRKLSELEQKLALLTAQDSLRKDALRRQVDSLKAVTRGVPVAPFGDTLFQVFTRLGPLSQTERAEAIRRKIVRLAHEGDFTPDSLRVFSTEQTADLVYNDLTLLSITDRDSFWHGKPKAELAQAYRKAIVKAVQEEVKRTSLRTILIEIGLAVLAVVVLWLVIRGISRLFEWLKKQLFARKEKFFSGIRLKNYELLDSGRQIRAALLTLQALKVFFIVLALYLALPVIFSIFPFTEGLADTLFGYVLTPVKMIWRGLRAYIPNIFTILVIVYLTRLILRFVGFMAKEVERGALVISGFYRDWAHPTANMLKALVLIFMFIVIFPYLPGSDSPIFQGVSVFLGLLISLGSSTAIANMVAGLVITYMRPFQIGERVKVGEVTGDVIEKNLLVTRIRTIKNEVITVPNSTILSNYSVNYSTSANDLGLVLHTSVTIGYDVPWRQVHELLLMAATVTEGIMSDKPPFVLQTSLDDFYVSYQLNAYTRESHRMSAIYSALHQNIQDAFNEAGVEIMSPHYRAMRDGNQSTIPQG